MLASVWTAALVALFVWWLSTGAILMLVRRADMLGDGAHFRATMLTLPLFFGGWVLHWQMLADASVLGAYGGFAAAIAIWGWLEMAFLCGVITGPDSRVAPRDAPPPERFLRAWGAIAHGEICLALSLIALIVSSSGAANHAAMWTFAILYMARVSAKLNLFLGVPVINIEFLPRPMVHLASHFRQARMNLFFPVGVTLLTFAFACWLERIWASAPGSAEAVKFALLASLTALAILEHWAMVVPLQEARLWRWAVSLAQSGLKKPQITPARDQGEERP